ncbi:MAG TPA: PmeII family type II restriction endonuclease [Candidatus Saccharimonadales bacterium]|nr:PmeII family type II restriction endonuclease [Candidatus Saccharimonadales bacterium]
MTEQEKKDILIKARAFFKETVAKNHIKNVKKLNKLSTFKYNPFLMDYNATFLTGNSSPESIARQLVYARAMVTSINTSFGTHMQTFCSKVLSGFASVVSGIDIEFVDHLDNRKKYCQTKLGPQTINNDDIKTVKDHFTSIKRLAQVNSMELQYSDLIVGVFYGTEKQLSSMYKQIQQDYPVYVGKEFWHRLTGDENFYAELIDSFGEVAKEADGKDLLEEVIKELAEDIQKNYLDKGLL